MRGCASHSCPHQGVHEPESFNVVSWRRVEQRLLRSKWLSNPVLWLLVLWGLFIVYGTLLPFNFSAPRRWYCGGFTGSGRRR